MHRLNLLCCILNLLDHNASKKETNVNTKTQQVAGLMSPFLACLSAPMHALDFTSARGAPSCGGVPFSTVSSGRWYQGMASSVFGEIVLTNAMENGCLLLRWGWKALGEHQRTCPAGTVAAPRVAWDGLLLLKSSSRMLRKSAKRPPGGHHLQPCGDKRDRWV